MNIIIHGGMTGNAFSTVKFDHLTFSENGLLLKYRKEKEVEISFEELDKVSLKKYKLNPFVEFLCIAIPFLLIYITIQYFPSNLMIFVSIISVPPVLMTVINHKWYRFNVQLKDSPFFTKRVRLNKKMENIIILEKIQRECLNYNNAQITSAQKSFCSLLI